MRLVEIRPEKQPAACEAVFARHADELAAGAIATVKQDRIRLRPAERTEGDSQTPV
ncbi:MAG: hypothetical protein RML56_09935 [Burkholderiales bacterium]|nr:hypothetical protein [Burkholderiales bacterium]MDW8469228.1 hypothetical protein [Burkholderiales bacterium]